MKNLSKLVTLFMVSSVGVVVLLSRESRGDISPQYKCATYFPDMAKQVFGTDNRTYCCKNESPSVKPPQSMDACARAPWDKSGSGELRACADKVTGLVSDNEQGDIFGEDSDPLEFFLVPSTICNTCPGTTEATLLAAAKDKAAQFCEKEANFAAGPTKLVQFAPAATGKRVCDLWKFRCSCP